MKKNTLIGCSARNKKLSTMSHQQSGGEEIKPGTLHGGEEIKPGTLHGGEEIKSISKIINNFALQSTA